MRKSNERLRRAIEAGDAAAASRADRELHAVYIDATGNPKLVEILLSLKAKLRRLEVIRLGGSVVAARSADEHDDLIDSLAGGDVEAGSGEIEPKEAKHESNRSLRPGPGRP